MGLFRKRDTGTQIEPAISDVLLKALLESEPITREKALTLPAVSGAVDFISSAIASMPVRLYEEDQGKVYERSERQSYVKAKGRFPHE